MSGSVNKCILVGNLGNDPEIRSFQNGGRVCNLSVATSESWKDKESGEKKERTQWHRVVISNTGLIRVCEDYLKKGSKVYIEGQIETRKYTDKNGNDAYTTEIVLRPYRGNLTILDKGNSTPSEDFSSNKESSFSQTEGSFSETSGGGIDDEIPF